MCARKSQVEKGGPTLISAQSESRGLQLPKQEIKFHHHSHGDDRGRLFWWKGQLYRGIYREHADFYRGLFEKDLIQQWVDEGYIVGTKLTDLALDGFEFVLSHQRLPFVSYNFEWCAEMLIDAALHTLNLATELAQHRMILQDAHSYNILFDGPHAMHVDIGSIRSADDQSVWRARDEFRCYYVHPLRLIAKGRGKAARLFLYSYAQDPIETDLIAEMCPEVTAEHIERTRISARSMLKKILPPWLHPLVGQGMARARALFSGPTSVDQARIEYLDRVRQEITGITLPTKEVEGSGENQDEPWVFEPSEDWTSRQRSVYDVLSQLRPRLVLDLASRKGWYAQMAARLGSQVAAWDADEAQVTRLYQAAKREKLSILPALIDFRYPSPAYGFSGKELSPATQRFQSDMVLALDVVQTLAFERRLDFCQIAEGLAAFSKRWLLVEFAPSETSLSGEGAENEHPWYGIETFEAALRQHWRVIRMYPSCPSPHVLFLCERLVQSQETHVCELELNTDGGLK